MVMLALNNHVNVMVMLVLNNHVTYSYLRIDDSATMPSIYENFGLLSIKALPGKGGNLQRCVMALESNVSGSKCGKTEFEAHGILAIASAYMMIIAKSMLNLKALDMF